MSNKQSDYYLRRLDLSIELAEIALEDYEVSEEIADLIRSTIDEVNNMKNIIKDMTRKDGTIGFAIVSSITQLLKEQTKMINSLKNKEF